MQNGAEMKEGNMKYKKYLKKVTAAVSVAAVGITTVMAPMAVSAKTAENMGLTLESVQANDYVLYTVNCGTPDPSIVPNQESERMGLLQSNVEEVDSICSPQSGHRQQKNNQGNNDSHSFTSYIYRYKNKRFAHPERSFLWNILSNLSHFP